MKFLKLFFLVLITLTLSCTGNARTAPRTPEQVVSHAMNSTAALVMPALDGNIHVFCSAVFISKNVILTANHCVDQGQDNVIGTSILYSVQNEIIDVDQSPRAVHESTVFAADPDHDLALLKTKTIVAHDIAAIAKTSPVIGERVMGVGHLSGLYFSFMYGTVSQVRNDMGVGFGKVYQLNISSWFGSSGGPALNEKGEIFGITSFLMKDAPGFVFYIHLDSIRAFLAKNQML